ncbi:multiheme c-type cytochrome [Segetibacter koreensis]|uniref:multiheme c-type cytochrome n=1 Tax=Segetibacter koreensis TaxID=398037 RepID=UPI0003761DF8|nr:multiheme c-type cytochrome [Segetibacter koreensis]
MKIILTSKKLRLIAVIIVSIAFFTKCINNNKKDVVITNNSGEQFAGSSACKNCHSELYKSFINTAHFHTSQAATKETILGSFNRGENVFSYSYYSKVAMEERDSGLYQVGYDKNFHQQQAYKFDIIIGSGTRGQSYLSWVKNRLIQLPISFFTSAKAWANSPGFPYYQPQYTRAISARCLECHSTYFKTLPGENITSPEYDRNQILYGVQCESCHGPANKHVVYHQQHQGETKGKFIDNLSSFTRQQKLDLCGFCHGGIRQSEKPAFSFSPGDTLSGSKRQTAAVQMHDVEVHDNQYALLSASKCFRMSNTMTCNTCHNTHQQERGNVALFSKKCMNCHNYDKGSFCKMAPTLGNQITKNCIDCHMPQKESKMLTLQLEGKANNSPSTLRSHVIAIYPGETSKYLSVMKQ